MPTNAYRGLTWGALRLLLLCNFITLTFFCSEDIHVYVYRSSTEKCTVNVDTHMLVVHELTRIIYPVLIVTAEPKELW